MPTYLHVCEDKDCNYEWEDFYSIIEDPPKVCPKCGKETAKRLISGGSGRGIVELSGNELKEKIDSDVVKLKHKARTDENFLANMVGEDKYQRNVVDYEKQSKIRRSK